MVGRSSTLQAVISSVALIGSYAFVSWRIIRSNPGNRVIECGSIALVVFFVMAAAFRIPNLPDWIVPGRHSVSTFGFLYDLLLAATGL